MRLPSLLRRLSRPGPAAEERLGRVERELRALRREARSDRKLLLRTQAALDALVRKAYVDPAQLDYPHRLTSQRFGLLSQNGEDGLLLALIEQAGPGGRTFAEVGCGTNGGNSGFLARELGWSGVMIDGSKANLDEIRLRFNEQRVRPMQAFVTRENIDDLLRANGIEDDLDVLSIDIDGNDLWVWEALSAVTPRIVVVEYNAVFGPTRSVAVPYDADHVYEPESSYYGASLAALAAVAKRKGYRLVAVEPAGRMRSSFATTSPRRSPRRPRRRRSPRSWRRPSSMPIRSGRRPRRSSAPAHRSSMPSCGRVASRSSRSADQLPGTSERRSRWSRFCTLGSAVASTSAIFSPAVPSPKMWLRS